MHVTTELHFWFNHQSRCKIQKFNKYIITMPEIRLKKFLGLNELGQKGEVSKKNPLTHFNFYDFTVTSGNLIVFKSGVVPLLSGWIIDGRILITDDGQILGEGFNWDVPKSLLAGKVSSMQVGVSARDFWLSTDYSGWNPDVSQFGNVAVGGSVDTGTVTRSTSSKSIPG